MPRGLQFLYVFVSVKATQAAVEVVSAHELRHERRKVKAAAPADQKVDDRKALVVYKQAAVISVAAIQFVEFPKLLGRIAAIDRLPQAFASSVFAILCEAFV